MIEALMVCLGREPRVADWKARTIPLSFSSTPYRLFYTKSQFLPPRLFCHFFTEHIFIWPGIEPMAGSYNDNIQLSMVVLVL